MDEEILNIDYHIKHMVVKAFNVAGTITKGCELLGISERSARRYRKMYRIEYDRDKKQWELPKSDKVSRIIILPSN
jgi:hypothetical protein